MGNFGKYHRVSIQAEENVFSSVFFAPGNLSQYTSTLFKRSEQIHPKS